MVTRKGEEKDRMFKLLMGIGPEFNTLGDQILTAAELPSFNTVCARIQKEETLKQVNSSYQKGKNSMEAHAFNTR